MPNEKAHGIQIAKMCEAFITSGVDVTLVVPSRGSGNLKQFYGLAHEIPLRRLPVWNLQFLGPIGYRLTAFQFALSSLLYMWAKALLRERFIVYTIDMDSFSFAPLAWVPRPLCAEMHSTKRSIFLVRRFFKCAHIIATNRLIADGLAQTFGLPPERICVEPNGVDESVLQNDISPHEARAKLNLPPTEPFALYAGRFYKWKGLEILADAAASSPLPIYLVGGTREEYEHVTKKSGEMLHFAGAKSADKVPLWLAAADV
ncbi:MAG: glycosyltransferase family 4 protein, partial [Patescibacteria group bacterium]